MKGEDLDIFNLCASAGSLTLSPSPHAGRKRCRAEVDRNIDSVSDLTGNIKRKCLSMTASSPRAEKRRGGELDLEVPEKKRRKKDEDFTPVNFPLPSTERRAISVIQRWLETAYIRPAPLTEDGGFPPCGSR